MGQPSAAAEIYRLLVEAGGGDGVALRLGWATALLDADRATEAENVLREIPEPRTAAWRVRAGLAALRLGKRAAAQAEWDAIRADEVPAADLPWYYFLTGALYDTAAPPQITRANQFYQQAEQLAPNELARALFQLAGETVRLWLVEKPSETALQQTLERYEANIGRNAGFSAAKIHAVMLAELGRRADAVTFLQRALQRVPAVEHDARDDLQLVLGLIGERGRGGAGRAALTQLLESGSNRVRQQQALQLLAANSREEGTRGIFRQELDRLIARNPPHPLVENLLFYRAQLALSERDFAGAERDAGNLVEQFPLSPLRVHALGILTQSAWEQRRFRLAADFARRARAEPGAVSPRVRAELGLIEAEALFRAQDFRSAADTYAAVLRERPAELAPERVSALMYQRVLAEIRAGSGEAGKVLDELARDPAFDVEQRWRAEWSLARELPLRGEAGLKEAQARVNALLARPAAENAALKPELRARMAWLQAKLASDNGEYARAIELADALLSAPLELEPKLRDEVVSVTLLLKANAQLALGGEHEQRALKTFERLRSEHELSEAAISSYLFQSQHYADQDKIGEARNWLVSLTDKRAYQNSPYLPQALLRLALYAEKLGGDENLKEAIRRIEDMIELVTKSPLPGQADLIFEGRLKQGDILRARGEFSAAQQTYQELVNRFPQRPDIVHAQLRLAQTHNVLSAEDPLHAENARRLFEQLRDRVDAPLDIRVEAGYNLGKLLERQGKADAAAAVWWTDVANEFLKEDAALVEPGATRRFWLARTLCELGELQRKRGRLEEAKEAYLRVIEKGLPYDAVARAALQQLGVPVKPGQ